MNRLVIVGNGFDLAHGLPTGYCDFIDWYWRDVISKIILFEDNSWNGDYYEDSIIKIEFRFQFPPPVKFNNSYQPIIDEFMTLKTYEDLNYFIEKYGPKDADRKLLSHQPHIRLNNCNLKIKNTFFGIVNNTKSIQNWVDIEQLYYNILKDCLKPKQDSIYKTDVYKLNNEFEMVKSQFENYLQEQVCKIYNFKDVIDSKLFTDVFKINARFLDATQEDNTYLKEFPKEEEDELISWDNSLVESLKYIQAESNLKYSIDNVRTIFLNFNYTPTVEAHLRKFIDTDKEFYGSNECIHIHGKIGDPLNPINFGFGDEMDDDYKQIERKNENQYLKNMKSFLYSHNDNYRNLLNFIDGEKFQVFIMGHSCGLSDRILLNTIFEHENCKSIKIFFHQRKDGSNDYTNIVQNISRHFNDKKLMRRKIVNKSLCKALPQDIRFEKK